MVLSGAAIELSQCRNNRYQTNGGKAKENTIDETDGGEVKKVAKSSAFKVSQSQGRNLKTLIKELKEQKLAEKAMKGTGQK